MGFTWTLTAVLTLTSLATAQPKSHIVITDNGYEDLVAAIHPSVEENPKIIDELKKMVTTGSEYLYTATRERAYFRSIRILVPSTWEDKPEYESATWETFEEADLRVDKKNPVWGHNPYTKQPGGCGEPGHYIHLTPQFLTDNMTEEKFSRSHVWGDAGRVFVHEFAHLRWGVFDEYGFENDPDHPLFYQDNRGSPRVTGCIMYPRFRGRTLHKTTKQQCARDAITRLPEKDCRFYPELGSRNRARASVMFMQFVNSVDTFCESNHPDTYRRHDALAPNKHNKMCNQQGTWNVITKHADFDNTNFPRSNVDTAPEISVVYRRNNPQDVVLVLDSSGSMLKNKRYLKLNQGVAQFIHDTVRVGSKVGVVQFSSRAAVKTPKMVTIASENDKESLLSTLPGKDELGGGTGIGGALLTALELLSYPKKNVSGTNIILVTDGKENRHPNVSTVMPEVIKSGVVVNAIAYTNDAGNDELEMLSESTGGLFFFCAEDEQVVRLNNALDKALNKLSDNKEIRQELASYAVTLTNTSLHERSIKVDETVGRNTEFTFAYPDGADIKVTVKSPDGESFQEGHAYYYEDTRFSFVKVSVPLAKPGKWSYTVSLESPETALLQVGVKSKSRTANTESIRVSAWLSSIALKFPAVTVVLAEVKQGYAPVIGASVHAIVERPAGGSYALTLADNGNGADSQKDDGIYSAYFTAFTGNGKYSVRATVTNGGQAKLKTGGGSGGGAMVTDPDLSVVGKATFTNAPEFERSGTAGGFSVQGYDSSNRDPFPPCRIKDLAVMAYSSSAKTVTLSWTAPGEDLDQGTVRDYEIRMSSDDNDVTTKFQHCKKVTHNEIITHPKILPSGGLETIVVRVPEGVFFFRIRAVDKSGQYSEPSNIVSAGEPPSDTWQVVLVAVCCTVVALAIVATSVICYVKKKATKKNAIDIRRLSLQNSLPKVA